jgi:sterol desaturase/sphingolipid hydroxylase (fatty acid hydroxylase superfamily)
MIVFAAFALLLLATLWYLPTRSTLLARTPSDWALDGASLFIQGVVVPTLQIVVVVGLLHHAIPHWAGAWRLNATLAFFCNFVLVDYLYYLNHRLLHVPRFWPIHAVHHTPRHMDVFITSRNTLWTPIFIVYLWVNGFFIFVLRDPNPFILGASLTAALDLWRHSTFGPRPGSWWHKLLSTCLITPHEHAWHHSAERMNHNFGANFNWWDKLHGTFYKAEHSPKRLGVKLPLDFTSQLLNPYGWTPLSRAREREGYEHDAT